MLPCRLGRLACVIGVDGAAWFAMDMVGGSLGNRWWADRDTAASRCVHTGRSAVAQPYENPTVCKCLTQQACGPRDAHQAVIANRSEEHTSELQSLMRISYAVFCLKKKTKKKQMKHYNTHDKDKKHKSNKE